MPDSDTLYHLLFGHLSMVENLIRDFAPPDVVSGLDFSRLERVNSKFHFARDLAQRREGDVIWRLPTDRNSSLYLYVLIEFQTNCDAWMAVRGQVYQGLLWQQIIDGQKLSPGSQLPPLLMMVLHRGDQRWKCATTTGELIAISPDSTLWRWQPQARYHILDMGAFPKDQLARQPSAVALLFRLEQRQSPDELVKLVAEVIDWFDCHSGNDPVRSLFCDVIRTASEMSGLGRSEFDHVLARRGMLETSMREWKEQWIAEGEAEGRAAGKAEAWAENIINLLTHRFGELEPVMEKQIRGADLVTLKRWFNRAIASTDLKSVFEP